MRRPFLVSLSLLLTTIPLFAQSIITVAGGGTDDGRPARYISIPGLTGIATDASGNLYFADGLVGYVRRVDATTGLVTTVAGVGTLFGGGGDGGPATEAELTSPGALVVDSAGNIWIGGGSTARRVDATTGIITTIAGGGSSTGDGEPATEAKVDSVSGLAVDATGNVYIADSGQDRIRRVDAVTGLISTVAGSGAEGFAGDGGKATDARLFDPAGLAIDSMGNLLISDRGNHRIRSVDLASGLISTIAGTGVAGFSGDGQPALAAQLNGPEDVDVDAADDIWIADGLNFRCRKISRSTGLISSVAGDGSEEFSADGEPAVSAGIGPVGSLALDSAGNLFASCGEHGRVRRVEKTSGLIATVAGNGQGFYWGDRGPATAAGVWMPGAVKVDGSGNLLIGSWLRVVRKVDSKTGVITVFAGNGSPGSGGDDGPATDAQLSRPIGLATDSVGNVYISDRDAGRIRKVDAATGLISTFAGGGSSSANGVPATSARLVEPRGIAVDQSGNLFVADKGRFVVRKIDAATSIISTVAGNGTPFGFIFFDDGEPATTVGLWPEDVAVDSAGDLYIADVGNDSIRKVDAFGIIWTPAGGGFFGYEGDGGPATEALLTGPVSIAFDASDNLFIADQLNGRIRRVDGTTGIIDTIAGNGDWGYSGDGGPSTQAGITWANGVAADADGNLYFSDLSANRIRMVGPCGTVSPPSLQSPSDGSSGISTAPVVSWSEASGARRYRVYVDTVDPPEKVVADDADTTSFSLANLEPLTVYFWRVVAKGDPFCDPVQSAESAVRSFTTASFCDVPGTFGAIAP